MDIIDALVLKNLNGVGDVSITNLLSLSDDQSVTCLEDIDIKNVPLKKVPQSLKDLLEKKDFSFERAKAQEELDIWDNNGIKVIHLSSDKYPQKLKEVDSPPPFLFCKGDTSLMESSANVSIAVIGTRENTDKGKAIATKTVEKFHEKGCIIVSGLALGIDTIAHRAALDCGAPTISVLVDIMKIAPSSNTEMADEIVDKGGLLVSENKPGTPMIPALFAKRDRIQAGLSSGVFAIETSIKGGTMHAVRASIKMQRPVFVPDVIQAKYPDLNIKAIEGTQHLERNEEAEYYSAESYDNIFKRLENITKKINKENNKEFNKETNEKNNLPPSEDQQLELI